MTSRCVFAQLGFVRMGKESLMERETHKKGSNEKNTGGYVLGRFKWANPSPKF